jgi:hypothetical protein
MKNTPIINISKAEAEKHYKEYLETVKTRKEKYLTDLKQVYYHLSQGHKVLDIYEVFKQSGVNKDGEPQLALCQADERQCGFRKQILGSGRFYGLKDGMWKKSAISLPSSTFGEWKTEKGKDEWNKDDDVIVRREIKTTVPIVPAHLLPEGRLDNYYILWEVSGWEEVPQYADPFLLKRINDNAFIILAEWDLTEVEQAVIRGL